MRGVGEAGPADVGQARKAHMQKQHRMRTSLLATIGLITGLLLIAPAANAASVTPTFYTGNPTCEDFGYTTITKFDPPNAGTTAGITLIRNGGSSISWTSTVAIDAVMVKGGPNGNIYEYPNDTFSDTNLVPPTNPMNGEPYGLSHVNFCTDNNEEPGPEPGISVVKDGPATAAIGDQITYTFAVSNTGNVTLSGPNVSDDKCAPLVRKAGETDTSFDPGDTFNYTCTMTVTAAMGDSIHNTVTACGTGDSSTGPKEVCDTDDHTTEITNPGVVLEKAGVDFAYAGETVTYTFTATNTGNKTLSNVVLTDSKCTDAPVRTGGNADDATFNPGDVWTYSCTAVVPSGTDEVTNTAEVCGEAPGGDTEDSSDDVCDSDTHTFPVRSIDILVDKNAVENTAVAGSVVHFTISVTNTGNTDYVDYTFDDPTCTGGAVRTGSNAGDMEFDAGDTWTYSCAMQTAAGDTVADNTASATGTNSDDKSVTGTDKASIPLTQPGTTPPPGGSTPPPSGGGVLPEENLSGRARLRGPSGCVKKAFRARVTGRSIASVSFYVDGKLVKRFTGQRASYSIKVRPTRLGFGRHKVVARVKFTAASGTKARRLPLTFRRCARQAIAPRFTG
jgi:uncharacterized repeat protein (TIGR01451 family)